MAIEKELQNLNNNPDLNKENVVEMMRRHGLHDNLLHLHIASGLNCDKIADCLIKAGANVNLQNGSGKTPLHYAARSGDVGFVSIANGADVNSQNNEYSWYYLYSVAVTGNVEVAKLLIANGADVNSQDKYGETPLHYAARSGNVEVVKVLIATNRADVNSQDKYGKTPLHGAAMTGRTEVAKFLIANGADVNLQNVLYRTPLHGAAMCGRTEVAKFLIANEADVNSQDEDGRTPLHDAAMYGTTEVAKLLIANGADVNSQDEDGKTPLQYALAKDHLKVAGLLINKGANQSCVPAYINKKSQEKGEVYAIAVAGISAIVTQPILLYSTELSIYAFTGATIASMILAGGIAFGLAYMWKKHELSSKLDKAKCENATSLSPQLA